MSAIISHFFAGMGIGSRHRIYRKPAVWLTKVQLIGLMVGRVLLGKANTLNTLAIHF
jgi:hypothetical protein